MAQGSEQIAVDVPASSLPARPSPWRARFGAVWLSLALASVIGAVVWSIAAEVRRGALVPSDGALAAAAAIVNAELEQGDAIAFAPAWSASQRWRMARIFDHHAIDFDAAAIISDPVTPWEVDGFQRLWILTTHDHAAKVDVAALGTELRHEELGDGVALLLIDLPRSATVFDFRQILEAAVLERVTADGKAERCTSLPDKLDCRGEWWRDVFSGWNEVGGSRHRCIFLQPHPAGGVTRLAWAKVPDATALVGRFGNRLWAVRAEEGSPVELRVVIGERARYTLTVQPHDFRWHPFRIDLDPAERGQSVRFEWRSEVSTWRQTCLDARLLGPPRQAQ